MEKETVSVTNKTVIMFGYRCNNRCIFCYNDDKRNRFRRRTTNEIKEEILSARSRGTEYLEIIGGEPTIRKDIIKLVKYAKHLGFETVMFASNGRMFYYRDFAERIIDAGISDLVLSIHGHNPQIHDYLTGSPGSFVQLMKGLENLKSLGFDRIGTNTTIVKQNYKHLPQIGRFIYDLGIRNSEFIYIDPTHGAPKHNFSELVPRISEIREYVHNCLDIGKDADHWHIRYMPICYVESYLGQISEIHEKVHFHTEHIAPDFINLDVSDSRKRISRQKTDKCNNCKYFNVCEGIWTEYLKHYGDEELRPVKGKMVNLRDIQV